MGTGFVMGFVFGVARVAAGVIYKSSARISAGGTALPIKRVATTRPSAAIFWLGYQKMGI